MYKRVSATGDPAISVANFVFKRSPNRKDSQGYPVWEGPELAECMQLASYSKLKKMDETEQRWEVEKNSSFYMVIKKLPE